MVRSSRSRKTNRKVAISNPDKILYPGGKFTKANVWTPRRGCKSSLKNFKVKDAQRRLLLRFFYWWCTNIRVYQTNNNTKQQKGKQGKMKFDNLKTLYINELRDLYNAEGQLVKALPKMAKAASSQELKEAFEKHLEQTKNHVERLEEVFEDIGEKPKGKTCKAMKGLVEEGSELLDKEGDESVIDAGIIVAAQKVEHYEIAGYGSVRTFAELLGKNKSVELLQTTLNEESETNETLNQLAEGIVNPEALTEPEMAGAGAS
jgi:ferritin-like metal-binding protein YciE